MKEIAFWERNGLRHGEFELPDQSLDVVHIDFNSDSSLMALLCTSKDTFSVLICARSNWQWQVKQQITNLTQRIQALKWVQKQQLFLAFNDGTFSFTEFDFCYKTSLKSFNHKSFKNLAYVCVVVDQNLNLTPLGRFLMPPPMFEKQIKLESFPLFVDMYGQQVAALCADGKLVTADCMSHQ